MPEKELIYTILGSGVLGGVFVKILSIVTGKPKERIEIALKYQEFYEKHIDDLKVKIAELSTKVEVLIEKDNQKSLTIDNQKKHLKKWETYCEKLKKGIEDRDKTNSLLMEEIEMLKNAS